jgi:hypothetical protein
VTAAPLGREKVVSTSPEGDVYHVLPVIPIGLRQVRDLRKGDEITVRVNNLTETRVVFRHGLDRGDGVVLVCHSLGRPDDPVEVGPRAVVRVHRTRKAQP